MNPNMTTLDGVLFRIKMDIMMVKSEVLQLKDDLVNYFDSILNLHLNHFKVKSDDSNQLNMDCELGLKSENSIDEESESLEDEESLDDEETSEASIDEGELIYSEDLFKSDVKKET